jgi:amino acid adenylation domain-containing protein/non-ribosomal peptide synthase protein (TIGR01720 family)
MYSEPLTLVDLVQWRAQYQPDRVAYIFLSDGETEESRLTYGELDVRARAAGAWLQSLLRRGDRVLLLYPPGLEYLTALFGCLYAGMIAVPAYPPRPNRSLLRIQSLVADAGAVAALTTASILSRVTPFFSENPQLETLQWLTSDNAAPGLADNWQKPAVRDEDLAFLQYTSGSTSTPRGVMLSHKNLLHNERIIQKAFQQSGQSIIAGWLPFYHDMGLIGNVLQSLFVGAPCIFMSPISFLQRPVRWLQAISRYRATTSGGPNFAYDLCVRKISAEQRSTLDLSSWSVAFNGAEPIRAETLERFASAFAACGFRREAFRPCYGLAEATLLVSVSARQDIPLIKTISQRALENNRIAKPATEEKEVRQLVSCGKTISDERILIVNPDSMALCKPDEVGEVWVSSPSVAAGYWNNAEETRRTFQAHLSDTGEGPFLRTGDLGFIAGGELFLTGRLKDLIIIRGLNHYPQDIELSVEKCHQALRSGCGAAFSVTVEGEEQLVIVQEAETRQPVDWQTLIASIRDAVGQEHEVQVHAVALVKAGTVPKTSSGKIQRRACRAMFLEQRLETVAEWRATDAPESHAAPATSCDIPDSNTFSLPENGKLEVEHIEGWLRAQLAAKMRMAVAEIDVHQPIMRYGLDSLLATELTHGLKEEVGADVTLNCFLQNPSISQLAAQVLERLNASSRRKQVSLSSAREKVAEYPLSQGQQALWFLHQMSPQSAAYNIARAVRIHSAVDTQALRRALQALVDRHPTMRTTFASPQGDPIQQVHDHAEVALQDEDASRWNERALQERLIEEAHRPFDLGDGPLLRFHLFRRSSHQYVLLLVAHHIVSDLWSLIILMGELGIHYEAERQLRPATLTPLALDYTDYVKWQEEMLESSEGQQHWEYWRQQLQGELPVLNLPTDRPRPLVQTYNGAVHSFRLNPQLARELKALSREAGATLYMTLLAAFQVLLARHTGQKAIIVGSPTAGRQHSDFTRLVGYFINPVALRADLSADPTFISFLEQVRQTVLAAFEHQDYPFALLVKRLQPERAANRSTIFQVAFFWQKAHLMGEQDFAEFALGEGGAQIEMGSLRLESQVLEHHVSQFDMTLTMAEAREGVAASIEYNTDLFDATTIQRMARHLEVLLQSIADNSRQRLSELPLLTKQERQQILYDWNETGLDHPVDVYFHQLFEAQVERTPEAVAVIYEGQQLSYAELNRRANRLAHYLRGAGVAPEVLVGILMKRSIEMIVALLGVLKAGGAYVPLDPAYPQERLGFTLDDAGMQVLLTQQPLLDRLPENSAKVICLDADSAAIAQETETNPPCELAAGNLAYVIYTSGSTGKPKGVAITHRSAVTFIRWAAQAFSRDDLAGVLASTSICFDLSVFELFTPFSCGGTVILAENAFHLTTLEAAEQVTLLNTVPTAITELLRMDAVPESVRVVGLGGEASQNQLVQDIYALPTIEAVYNLYGPTEDTVYSTYALLEKGATRPPTMGRPITNTEVYILDRRLQPTPVGVPGDLYIGGDGLARGYLNRPALTAAKFIPNPYSRQKGARLYHTGDVAYYMPNGNIEYLGRLDHQVKIRGFRIELGEIEAALQEHPAVREAVVIARAEEGEEERLAAYVVAQSGETITAGELRAMLKEKLPDYMAPSAFITVEEIPQTPNGKVDRGALLAIDYIHPARERQDEPPRTAVEQQIAAIWKEVLKVEHLGIHDNFFDMGGDSILSTKIVSQARLAGLPLTLQQVFQYPTVAELAATVVRPSAIAGEEENLTGSFPLTPIQCWFFEQQFIDPHHWNQAIVLQPRRALNPDILRQAVGHLLKHHDALRLRFMQEGGDWKQSYAAVDEDVPFIRYDLPELMSDEQREAIERTAQELQASLNISDGPLIRVAYFAFGQEKEGRLLLVIHHLAVDGVSWQILLEDLEAIYRQTSDGQEVRLPQKTTAFKTWAERLTAYARSTAQRQEISYWLAQSRSETSCLPRDERDGDNNEASAQTVTVRLSEEETQALLQEVAHAYRTQINDVLLAALGRVLSRWSGARRVLIDVKGHAREGLFKDADLSRTVGWFTTLYPVALELGESLPDVGVTLQSVKGQLRAVPNHGIGYGLLRYSSVDEEAATNLRSAPQAETLFNYLGRLNPMLPEGSPFHVATEALGPSRSPRARRSYLIEFNGFMAEGRLQIACTYSENIHRRATIERLAQEFNAELRQLISHCRSTEAAGAIPSDFPLAEMDQEQLDQAFGQVSFDE